MELFQHPHVNPRSTRQRMETLIERVLANCVQRHYSIGFGTRMRVMATPHYDIISEPAVWIRGFLEHTRHAPPSTTLPPPPSYTRWWCSERCPLLGLVPRELRCCRSSRSSQIYLEWSEGGHPGSLSCPKTYDSSYPNNRSAVYSYRQSEMRALSSQSWM